ncbi:MFS transporter [Gryllotalpicola protaetiae]|uniref:MFS transporter n=1 Tax=Gryllotalpicola protaetiae TaxID=2419771 RepID=A0A387BQ76_9MICO|nr:MFS transporter [Gryllotalpicola protaetiae]AYG04662.1 MFS transporter [Gryllotalpicola protaetiae]
MVRSVRMPDEEVDSRSMTDAPLFPPSSAASQLLDPRSRRRLLVMFGPASFSISLVWGAVTSVLLALQVQHLVGESDKVAQLALVSTAGAVASLLSQPIAGFFSDRTRNRLGRRAPWMLAGVVLGGVALVALAFASTIPAVAIAWVVAQIGFNAAWAPLTAVMPDRVPTEQRGTFASLWGLGVMLGTVGGQVYGAAFASDVASGYVVLAGLTVVIIGLFVIVCMDGSSRQMSVTRMRWRELVTIFWFNPVRHPDFGWAFLSRMCAYAGFYVVFGFQLYILQDYIGLGDGASAVVARLGIIIAAGVIISTAVVGRLSDRLGRRKPFVIIAAVMVGAALIAPLASPTAPAMYTLAVIAGLGFGCFQAIDTALVSEVLPSTDGHGKDLGIVNIAGQLPNVLAPGIAGGIVLATGGYAALFPVGMALAAASALAVLPIKGVK